MKNELEIRPIQPGDNAVLALVIRSILEEFDAAKPGTVYTDPTTDRLFELFQTPQSAYFVAVLNGEIVGGCGIYPTKGMPEGCTELVKLYLAPATRGKGVGKALMERCFEIAKEKDYTEIYLETLPELHIAVGLYERMGFEYLEKPYGESGHFACDLWMARQL
jgi:putative acetyltransferase